MKKYIAPIVVSIVIGFMMGLFMWKQYDKKESVKPVFNATTSVPLYFLQQGVYSSKDNMQNGVTKLNHYIYTEEGGKFYVYVAIVKGEANMNKLKGIYESLGYTIYSKQINIDNDNFTSFVAECEQLIEKSNDTNALLKVEEQVLAKYEELVIRGRKDKANS